MLDPIDFTGRPRVELLWARDQGVSRLCASLQHQLQSEEWRKCPSEWADALVFLLQQGDGKQFARTILRRFVECQFTITSELQTVLSAAWPHLVGASGVEADLLKLVELIQREASPGLASLIADLVAGVTQMERWSEAPFILPLATSLVRFGVAELRTQTRAGLLRRLALGGLGGEVPVSRIALELGLGSAHAVEFWHRDEAAQLWEAVEAVVDSCAVPELVLDACRAARSAGGWELPLEQPDRFPRTARRLVEAACDGALDLSDVEVASRVAVCAERLGVAISFGRAEAARAAVMSLPVLLARDTTLSSWAASVLRDWIKYGLVVGFAADEVRHADGALTWSRDTALKFLDVIRSSNHWLRNQSNPALLFSLGHRTPGSASGAIGAARATLALVTEDRGTSGLEPDQSDWTSELQARFREILSLSIHGQFYGVRADRLFDGARDVRLRPLSGDDKVRVEDGTLLVDPRPYLEIARNRVPRERLALAMLYFLHEMVHRHQGVDRLESVQAIRQSGAEESLLHLDLAADHVAALLLSAIDARWTVDQVKRLQARPAFQVGPHHTSAARRRKARRRVSLLADVHSRASDGVGESPDEGGYAFVDYSPGGGGFVLFRSGPPLRVVGVAGLSAADAALLDGAADRDSATSQHSQRLDAIIGRLVGDVLRPA